jgi:hypothetical protein
MPADPKNQIVSHADSEGFLGKEAPLFVRLNREQLLLCEAGKNGSSLRGAESAVKWTRRVDVRLVRN